MLPPGGELRFARFPKVTLWFQTGLVERLTMPVRFTPSDLMTLPPRSTRRMSARGLDTPPFSVPSSPAASTISTSSILRARAPVVGIGGTGRLDPTCDTAGDGCKAAGDGFGAGAAGEAAGEAAGAAATAAATAAAAASPGLLDADGDGDSTEIGDFLCLPRLAGVPLPFGRMGLAREIFVADVGSATRGEPLPAAACAPTVAPNPTLPPAAAAGDAAGQFFTAVLGADSRGSL